MSYWIYCLYFSYFLLSLLFVVLMFVFMLLLWLVIFSVFPFPRWLCFSFEFGKMAAWPSNYFFMLKLHRIYFSCPQKILHLTWYFLTSRSKTAWFHSEKSTLKHTIIIIIIINVNQKTACVFLIVPVLWYSIMQFSLAY